MELLWKTVRMTAFLVTNPVLLSCMGAAVYLPPGEQAAWRAPEGLGCRGGYSRIKRLKMLMSLKLAGQEKQFLTKFAAGPDDK